MRDSAGTLVHLGLGSNQGDRLAALRRAVAALDARPDIEVVARSGIWETEPVGQDRQDPYLNACVAVVTTLAPLDLLDVLKALETAAGRRPDGHGLPRPIDLDILLYGELVLTTERLRVPHPELRQRAFVLEPLAQIAAARCGPDSGETIGQSCAKIRRKAGPWVRPFDGGTLDDNGDRPERFPGCEQGGPGCCPGATSSLKA